MQKTVNVKLKNGVRVDINDESINVNRVVESCENKIAKSIKKLDMKIREDLKYSISTFVSDKEIAYFKIYPSKLYDQAESLSKISEDLDCYFFDETEIYTIELTLEELIETDTSDIAKMIENAYIAYTNSIFCARCSENSRVHINDDTDEISIKLDDTISEYNDVLQLCVTYIINNKHKEAIAPHCYNHQNSWGVRV